MSYHRNLRDGSAILTAEQRGRTNQGKPTSWACFLKVSEGVPGSSGPPFCCSSFPLYFLLVQLHASFLRLSSPWRPLQAGEMHQPWPPCFLDLCMETGVLVTQEEGPVLGSLLFIYFPWAVWFWSPRFYSLLMTFSKVLWAPKLFPQSFLFLSFFLNIEGLILLFCFCFEILKKIAIVLLFKGYGTSVGRPET